MEDSAPNILENKLTPEILTEFEGTQLDDTIDDGTNETDDHIILPTVKKPPEERDENDTDLEEKENVTKYDTSGKTSYIEHCRKVGVVPAGYFMRHMNGSSLEMRHHGLGPIGIKPICSSLCTNGTVIKLDLTDNWLGPNGIKPILVALKENCFITDINLSENRIGTMAAEWLCEALSTNVQLQRVDLSNNGFDDKSAIFFADLIASTPRIEYLNLSHNNFGESSGMLLGKAIGDSVTLTECDLSWNHFRGKGAKGICVGIGINTVLKKFNLGWNGFGPVFGAQELGKAIKLNTTLEELDITNNRINAEGAVLIGKGLSLNTTLKVIKIGRNPMQTAGCYAIINALLKNPECSIVGVDFQDILVNSDFHDIHQLAVEQFPQLKVYTGTRIPKRPMSQIHPLVRLRTFARKNNINIADMFKEFDDDEDLKISQQEFRMGIETLGFNMTPDEINRLMQDLDKDGDGTVNYSELAVGIVNDDDQDYLDQPTGSSSHHDDLAPTLPGDQDHSSKSSPSQNSPVLPLETSAEEGEEEPVEEIKDNTFITDQESDHALVDPV